MSGSSLPTREPRAQDRVVGLHRPARVRRGGGGALRRRAVRHAGLSVLDVPLHAAGHDRVPRRAEHHRRPLLRGLLRGVADEPRPTPVRRPPARQPELVLPGHAHPAVPAGAALARARARALPRGVRRGAGGARVPQRRGRRPGPHTGRARAHRLLDAGPVPRRPREHRGPAVPRARGDAARLPPRALLRRGGAAGDPGRDEGQRRRVLAAVPVRRAGFARCSCRSRRPPLGAVAALLLLPGSTSANIDGLRSALDACCKATSEGTAGLRHSASLKSASRVWAGSTSTSTSSSSTTCSPRSRSSSAWRWRWRCCAWSCGSASRC